MRVMPSVFAKSFCVVHVLINAKYNLEYYSAETYVSVRKCIPKTYSPYR